MHIRPFTRFLPLAALLLLALALAASPRAARAQVTPDQIDKTQIRPSAHALGLGGSYLLLGDDPNGIITNPAAVAQAHRPSTVGIDLAAEGQTSNVNVTDLNNLANDISKINKQLSNTSTDSLAGQLAAVQSVQGSINDLYNFATDAGASQTDEARISGSVSLGAAARWATIGNFSIGTVGYGGLTADARLSAYQDTPNAVSSQFGIGNNVVIVNGGALTLLNIGIPIAYKLPGMGGTIGITPKYARAEYTGATGMADEGNVLLTGTSFKEVNNSTFDIDAGYTSSYFNVASTGATPIDLQGAFVVRHLISPSFSLANTVQNSYALTGSAPNLGPSNFNFTLHPELDLGGAAGAYGARLTVEEHNITSVNGGGKTFHVGAEYDTFKYIIPRIGYDNNAFVYGLGINILNYLQLDAAASTNVQQRLAADLSVSIGF